jgi:hypothetical protein
MASYAHASSRLILHRVQVFTKREHMELTEVLDAVL